MKNLTTIQIYCLIILEVRSFILNGLHGTKIKLLAELCPFWRLWERLSLPFPISRGSPFSFFKSSYYITPTSWALMIMLNPLHLTVLNSITSAKFFSWVKIMYSQVQGFWYGHLREGVIMLTSTQIKNYYDLGFALSFMAFYLKHKYTSKCWHWSHAKPWLTFSKPPPTSAMSPSSYL